MVLVSSCARSSLDARLLSMASKISLDILFMSWIRTFRRLKDCSAMSTAFLHSQISISLSIICFGLFPLCSRTSIIFAWLSSIVISSSCLVDSAFMDSCPFYCFLWFSSFKIIACPVCCVRPTRKRPSLLTFTMLATESNIFFSKCFSITASIHQSH